MSNKIGIDVQANFDTQRVDRGIDELGNKIKQVNRNPIDPVSDKAVQKAERLNAQFKQLLAVDAELRRRAKATNQLDTPYERFDFNLTHPDARARAEKQAAVRRYIGEGGGSGHPPPPHPGRPGGGGGFGAGALNVAQSGLRAAGPAGGVAASALGTGMSSGLGAGLGGLLGGMLALGVGKIVSGVMEKVGQAEDNDVGYDKLKRTLGDVNVSFDALKRVVLDGATNLRVTYGEFSGLASQFAKSANMSAGQFGSLPGEIGVGVGLSRSFGLDPSQGVGIMGQMRGMGITKDVNESKKFALLIGETIGKSGAFAKADEVMEAMGNYAVSQTRAGMGGANVAGYGGMFSAMVGSGIGGMDPAGAAGILSRMNSALSGGGAKGEASQFFTGMVGNRMGLDPFHTQIMREGGMFATNRNSFGKDSAYAKYMGKTGPGGNKTFLQGTIDTLNQQYGGNSDDQKLMRAQAFANHTGINMRQSMAILSLKSNQMGEIEKLAGDLTGLNAGGIGNMAKVVGSDSDRKGLAEMLKGRSDISDTERGKIDSAMKEGSVETQKQVLTQIIKSHDQEMTTGKDIKESKNALDNIKTSIADKLVPLTLEMRHGIMSIAGDGRKSSTDIMKGVVNVDSDARRAAIDTKFATEKRGLEGRADYLTDKRRSLDPASLMAAYRDKPEILAKKLQERVEVQEELKSVEKRLKEIEAEKIVLTKKENERKSAELSAIDAGEQAKWDLEEAEKKARYKSGAGMGAIAAGRAIKPADPTKVQEAMAFFMSEKGGGWSREQAAGIVAQPIGESQMDTKAFNGAGGGQGAQGQAQWRGARITEFERLYGKKLKDASHEEQWAYMNHELTKGSMKGVGDRLRKVGSAKVAGTLMSRDYEIHGSASEDAARGILAEKLAGTPMPAGASGNPVRGLSHGGDGGHATVEVVIVDKDRKQIQPSQKVPVKIRPTGQPLVAR